MNNPVPIELQPLGKIIEAQRGQSLQEILFAHGVEFPCGGTGRCRGCKVKVLQGDLPLTPDQARYLTATEIHDGWRLACQGIVTGPLTLDLAQWETPILADNTTFDFAPQDGLGIAIDVGTTTLAAQLLDLRTGHVLSVRTALNEQAQHGADIMSRVNFALNPDGHIRLASLIRTQIGCLIRELLVSADRLPDRLRKVILVGNTVMHHLFCHLPVEPLAQYPFETTHDGLQVFPPAALGWDDLPNAVVRFLPCLGSFVGSDILAGILATRLYESRDIEMLIDLGTNGEIVVGNADRLLCASTAAGPAFEGARISMGMRAATGAISAVAWDHGQLDCHVIGQGKPRGICGSGLVDAAAAGLELGVIQPNGRFANPAIPFSLTPPVVVSQADIRELQLAKGAIAAGIRLLSEMIGAPQPVTRVYLAGAFGNYINRRNARRIGLYQFDHELVRPAGNTALLGAKIALFTPAPETGDFNEIRRKVQHVPLSSDPRFQDIYAEEMGFPHS